MHKTVLPTNYVSILTIKNNLLHAALSCFQLMLAVALYITAMHCQKSCTNTKIRPKLYSDQRKLNLRSRLTEIYYLGFI